MANQEIKLRSRHLFVHKAIVNPDFNSSTVLTSDPWSYVSLYLQRSGTSKSRFLWTQASEFYSATKSLSPTAAPLTAYYCILNATKALLVQKNITFSPFHGCSGFNSSNNASLSSEMVRFKTNGTLAGLSRYLGENDPNSLYSLKDLLYNMPFIHRAFVLTYTSCKELFIPLYLPRFVRKANSSESWFCANIQGGQYQSQHSINKLASDFERDNGSPDTWTIRSKRRFKWKTDAASKKTNLTRLRNYHSRIRRHVVYINGKTRLWYIKRSNVSGWIPRYQLTMLFAASHRLSELARYAPDRLEKHFNCQHNWLLSEFVSLGLDQFVDQIASEITGHDFMTTGLRAQ